MNPINAPLYAFMLWISVMYIHTCWLLGVAIFSMWMLSQLLSWCITGVKTWWTCFIEIKLPSSAPRFAAGDSKLNKSTNNTVGCQYCIGGRLGCQPFLYFEVMMPGSYPHHLVTWIILLPHPAMVCNNHHAHLNIYTNTRYRGMGSQV